MKASIRLLGTPEGQRLQEAWLTGRPLTAEDEATNRRLQEAMRQEAREAASQQQQRPATRGNPSR